MRIYEKVCNSKKKSVRIFGLEIFRKEGKLNNKTYLFLGLCIWKKNQTPENQTYFLFGLEFLKKKKQEFKKVYYIFKIEYFKVKIVVLNDSIQYKYYIWGLYIYRKIVDPVSLIRTSTYFDGIFYLKARPDVKDAGVDAAKHYLYEGYRELTNPSQDFDNNAYLQQIPNVSINPLLHFEITKSNFKPQKKDFKYSYLSHYEKDEDYSTLKTDIKTVCYYLPQFYEIPENNLWWGEGFTEWTNVLPAEPRFIGHYQPRVPHNDIGAYNLSEVSTLKKQISLAKKHGIYGFCFYYYWFSGKKLLEKPLENLIKNPEIDFPFCLCWANENWTRSWDGEENNILMEQRYLSKDRLLFIEEIYPYLSDKRYIRNNNKPILLVYKVWLIPNPNEVFKIWRKYCRKRGLGEIEIWLVRANSNNNCGIGDVSKTFNNIDSDMEVEFPPHTVCTPYVHGIYHLSYDCIVKTYNTLVERVLKAEKYPSIAIVRSAMLAWDNTPRHKYNTANVFAEFSLYNYFIWLKYLIQYTRKKFDKNNRFLFINAWNEWAEGTYLEPDVKYGYANINTTSRAILGLPFEKQIPENAVVMVLLERLGDIVAGEPIVRYLKKKVS
ncbi:MAG: glycoside hydrolase family 99-like domain-containing protein [Elusimicrobiota bacterium]|jgi:hypothetical protein|nr:glycoside hydrolase family 99-like domain-containing protein [Elusimicrobiota bacterium]